MALTRWPNPDHVHVETSCIDHRDCPDDHWEGGRPEPEHPHYVEVDCSTGLVGYTRLTDEEIAERARLAEIATKERVEQEKAALKRQAALAVRAAKDPDFKLLLEHLGIPLK